MKNDLYYLIVIKRENMWVRLDESYYDDKDAAIFAAKQLRKSNKDQIAVILSPSLSHYEFKSINPQHIVK